MIRLIRRPDQPPVRLDLRLAGAAGADGALHALEVRPLARQARQQVLHLRQRDLEAALPRVRPRGEDVQDQRRSVNDLRTQRFFEIALLRRRQLVVEDDHVRLCITACGGDFIDLAFADVRRGVRLIHLLDGRAHDLRPGCPGQLAQFRRGFCGREQGAVHVRRNEVGAVDSRGGGVEMGHAAG